MTTNSLPSQFFKYLAFPFKDPDWGKKIAIGLLLSMANMIVPILPMLLIAGYSGKIMKHIILEKGDPYLPDWNDWGDLLTKGLKLLGAGFIFGFPVMVLCFAAMAGMMIPVFGLPFFIQADGSLPPESTLLMLVGFGIFGAMMMLAMPIGLILSLVEAPAFGHLVAKDDFMAAFRFKEWWPILRAGFGSFLFAILASMGLSTVGVLAVQFLNMTVILCWLYPFALYTLIFFLSLYQYTFIALAYRDGIAKASGT